MMRTKPGGTRNSWTGVNLTIVFLLTCWGCGAEEIVIPDRQATPLDMSTVGSLTGTVSFQGDPPARAPIPLGGFPACSAAHQTPPLDESILVEGGRLKNVFVYIKEGLGDRVFAVPTEPVVIDQKGCIYSPHVTGAQAYQPVKFLNSDSLLHNVHSETDNSKPFNFVLPVAGLERVVQFPSEEVMAHVKCDVHGWMSAYIGVVDHPYFAVTGADGAYRLDNLPPGDYLLEVWHEVLGVQSRQIRVGEREAATADFSFSGS